MHLQIQLKIQIRIYNKAARKSKKEEGKLNEHFFMGKILDKKQAPIIYLKL